MSAPLEMLAALVTVTVYAAALYALISHRSKQTARVQPEERR